MKQDQERLKQPKWKMFLTDSKETLHDQIQSGTLLTRRYKKPISEPTSRHIISESDLDKFCDTKLIKKSVCNFGTANRFYNTSDHFNSHAHFAITNSENKRIRYILKSDRGILERRVNSQMTFNARG